MHLIYVYLQEYRNYRDAAISFDNRFDVTFSSGRLAIAKSGADTVALDYMRNGRVDSLHLLVGKTGSGKTNLLQLIGERYGKRCDDVWEDKAGSYFLLYHLRGDEFFIEICDLAIEQFPEREREQIDCGDFFAGHEEESRRLDGVRAVRFRPTSPLVKGRPVIAFEEMPESGEGAVVSPVRDTAFILNAFDSHTFIKPPYADDRSLTATEGSGNWISRTIIPYHRASLWSTCDCIREYLSDVEPGDDKKQASFVLTTHNFAEQYPLKLRNAIESEYWTFWERERDADRAVFDEEAARRYEDYKKYKARKRLTNKQMFIHDLWADYAKYLRKWVEKIISYNAEETIPEENLDYSGTRDVYQEAIDYYTEKEYGEDIDPKEPPDGVRLSIVKRCIWLAEYIDRVDSRDPHGILWQTCDDIKDIGKILGQLDDKYFIAVDRFEVPIADMVEEGHALLFEDLFERMEQYIPDDAGIFTRELLPYEFTCLSTGEHQYARVLGVIADFLKMSTRDREGNKQAWDKIILLDEPEAYMHPELARQFLSRLLKLTEKYRNEGTIQVIIGTHSPLLVSDVFSEEVTRLDIDKKTGYAIVRNGAEREYFGANIHTVLADGFFLDYTIGEDSRAQLQALYEKLKRYVDGRSEASWHKDGAFIENVRSLTPRIGDDFIRMAFENQLEMLGEG